MSSGDRDEGHVSPKGEGASTANQSRQASGEKLFPVQADGGGHNKGAPDGVSASTSGDSAVNVHGRSAAGESGGGAYPNPHEGRIPSWGGFLGHGGQTNIGYHGSGQAGQDGEASPNATTRGDDDYSDQSDTGPTRKK